MSLIASRFSSNQKLSMNKKFYLKYQDGSLSQDNSTSLSKIIVTVSATEAEPSPLPRVYLQSKWLRMLTSDNLFKTYFAITECFSKHETARSS